MARPALTGAGQLSAGRSQDVQRMGQHLPCLCCVGHPPVLTEDALQKAIAPMCTAATKSTGPACAPRCFTMAESWHKVLTCPSWPYRAPFL